MSFENQAKEIFLSALESIKPHNLLPKFLHYTNDILHVQEDSYNLKNKKLHIFGSGKASLSMAKALHDLLQDKIEAGTIVYYESGEKIGNVKVISGAHPIPNEKSLQAGKELLEQLSALREDDFYIYLLSGGSSAMIEDLKEGISLEDLQESTKLMLHNAMSIDEINAVRKKISKIKGGGLVKKTKAQGIVLVMSDVIGDDLTTIGSAPLLVHDFWDENKMPPSKIFKQLPQSIQNHLLSYETSIEILNPKHYLIASNQIAILNAKQKAEELGFTCKVCMSDLEGDVSELLDKINQDILEEKSFTCNLYGGESTLHVKGSGQGGRNQHLALMCLNEIKKGDVTILCAGTDGIDGNSPAAGAVINTTTEQKSLNVKEYLDNFDSFSFFQKYGGGIMTGPTGVNVMDICIVLR